MSGSGLGSVFSAIHATKCVAIGHVDLPPDQIIHGFYDEPDKHLKSNPRTQQHPEMPKIIWIENPPKNGQYPPQADDGQQADHGFKPWKSSREVNEDDDGGDDAEVHIGLHSYLCPVRPWFATYQAQADGFSD